MQKSVKSTVANHNTTMTEAIYIAPTEKEKCKCQLLGLNLGQPQRQEAAAE